MRCWSRTYLGPPDFLHDEKGTKFVPKEVMEFAEADGIKVLEAPVEFAPTMSYVERYHIALRSAYYKICDSLDRT